MADNATQEVVCVLKDGNGKTGTTSYYVPTNTSTNNLNSAGVTDINEKLFAITCAFPLNQILRTTEEVVVGSPPSSGAYQITDKMALEFQSSIGTHATFHFPAPKSTCFSAPAYTSVVTTSPVSTLITTLETNMVDEVGGSYTYVRGYRSASRNLRPGSKKWDGY